jgi:hypothetical protein
MKPSKNPATEPTSCTGFEDASEGATRKPCTTPTKPSSVPSSNTAPPSTPPYTLPSSTKSPPAREECSAGSFDSPTGSPPSTSTRKPTQSRSNPASKKYPSRDGRLLNRIPKIPKRKLKHPPTALLSPAYTDLPDDLQELVGSTPLTMRWPSTTPGLPGLRTSNPVSPSNPPPVLFLLFFLYFNNLNNRTQKLKRTTRQQDHPWRSCGWMVPSTGPPRTPKTPSLPPSPICPT